MDSLKPECKDCGMPYNQFGLDLVLPDEQFIEINGSINGLLCPTCICRRASDIPGYVVVLAELKTAC
jgi:hypothetical protein